MIVTLGNRTADSVRPYFKKANRSVIKQVLPQKAKTVEEALEDYKKMLLPNAKSFGQTVYADGKFVVMEEFEEDGVLSKYLQLEC